MQTSSDALILERVASTCPSNIDDIRKRDRDWRISAVQNEWVIQHTRFQNANNYLLSILKRKNVTRAPGLFVVGPPGSGKTTFGNYIMKNLQRAPPTSNGCEFSACAVKISLTGLTKIRAVYGRLLLAINSPVTDKQRTADREANVVRILSHINCRLLILDEVQDVLKGSNSEQEKVIDAVKFLMNELSLPVLALGTRNAANAFVADSHMHERFRTKDLGVWKKDDDLLSLLASIECLLPLRERINLRTDPILTKLLELSGGVLSNIMEIIRNAAIEAIGSGTEQINAESLRPIDDVPDHRFLD